MLLSPVRAVIGGLIIFALGFMLGGYLFARSAPRSLIALGRCDGTCLEPNEIAGLLASVGVQRTPGIIPNVVRETEKTIAFESPVKLAPVHYLIIPKKDIKNIGVVANEDAAYITDAYAVMEDIIHDKGLKKYQIFTNGPGYQHVTYLHFHLMAE